MKPIHFPGGRDSRLINITETVKLNDFLQLLFDDAGFFSHDKTNIFDPKANLPQGFFEKKSEVISWPATKLGESIKLYFWDPEQISLTTCTVTVVP